MKRNVLFSFLFLLAGISFGFTHPAVKDTPTEVPPFKMMQTNGTFYSAADLPAHRPVVLIYFSPDCEHCLLLMNALFKRINEFKNTELVLVTFKPLDEVAAFEVSYNTKKYPFIKVGTEGTTFFLRYFYKIQNTPFTAVFNKAGKLVTSYRKTTPPDELIRQVRLLK